MARLVLAGLLALDVAGAQLVINGWYNCSIDTFKSELPTDDYPSNGSTPMLEPELDLDAIALLPMAQCALIQAPLCHKGVSCTYNKTIELFVKRVLSSTAPTTSPDVWFIQGGPGASSEGMESGMQDLIKARNGNVNVYTVDHRGTGRSNKLDCVAAQSTTSGSPESQSVTPEEFPACSADLAKEYGNDLSAFSVTSAASDIGWLINGGLKSDAGVFVYGVSYGTAVVERLIHLNVTAISGYVLDGVATSSGAGPAEKFEYFSTWDVDYGAAGDRFLEVCKNDTFCGSKFGAKGPAQTLKDFYSRIDSSAEAASCTGIPKVLELAAIKPTDLPPEVQSVSTPSAIVRKELGSLLQSTRRRKLIPVLIFRMNRCTKEDKLVLENYFNASMTAESVDESAWYESYLLYELITYSEMWEDPQPSIHEMQKRFTDQLITNGETASNLPSSCLYLMDQKSPACQELNIPFDLLPKDTLPIAYKHDQYWNISAKIADNASVLILNGKLDPQTHYRNAEYLYGAIQGEPETQKKLLLFEYLAHGTIFIPDEGADVNELPCAAKILASYVENGGKLSALNTSCMQSMKPINFTIDSTRSEKYLGTTDPYDGKLESNQNSSENEIGNKTYKTLFIVFVCLFVVMSVVAGVLFYRLRKVQESAKHQDGEAKFVQLHA